MLSILLDMIIAPFQLLFGLFVIVVKLTWPFWLIFGVIAIIVAIVNKDSPGDYDYTTSTKTEQPKEYYHRGLVNGSSKYVGNGEYENYDKYGFIAGKSTQISEGFIIHQNNSANVTAYSYGDPNGLMINYSKDGKTIGYTNKYSDGTIIHTDKNHKIISITEEK